MLTIAELKATAVSHRSEEKAAGRIIKHSDALEWAAKQHGFSSWRAFRATASPMPTRTDLPGPVPPVPQNEPEEIDVYSEYSVRRKSDAPIRFQGRIIGSAEKNEPNNNDYYERVTIYRSKGGKYIAEKIFDANHLDRPERNAASFADAKSVVDWLRHPETHELRKLAIQALSAAASVDDGMDAAFGEDID